MTPFPCPHPVHADAHTHTHTHPPCPQQCPHPCPHPLPRPWPYPFPEFHLTTRHRGAPKLLPSNSVHPNVRCTHTSWCLWHPSSRHLALCSQHPLSMHVSLLGVCIPGGYHPPFAHARPCLSTECGADSGRRSAAPPRVLDTRTLISCRWDTGGDGHRRIKLSTEWTRLVAGGVRRLGNAMHAVRTQCEVLDVDKYSNPSFGPFSQVFGSVPGLFLAS